MIGAVLGDAPWRSDPALLRLFAVLGGGEGLTRIVGGAVRDTLSGHRVTDIDLATKLLPDDVVTRLSAAAIKAVPTGIAHGTITAVADGHVFEVTTLRRDVATDGRRATVAFTDDWAADAARRDFTINALYADPVSGEVFDPTGGLADLAAHRVRFIGDAAARIDEDHLRILRYFRFHARFGSGEADAETLAIIAARAARLRSLSRERIADELLKLMALADPVPALRLMLDANLFAHMVPEVDAGAIAALGRLVAAEAAAGLPPDPVRRLIALLPTDPARATLVAARLKLSKRIGKRITAARCAVAEHDPRALAYALGREAAIDRALLSGDAAARLAALDDWRVPLLPISGGDIVALGVRAGPEVARILKAVEAQWVAEGFPDVARARAIARVFSSAVEPANGQENTGNGGQ
ncbi:MAG: CCA tRNA nucleotidyltransferase [Sphingopyxis sp.]